MNIKFDLFGDESIGQSAVIYGIVGVEIHLTSHAENIVRNYKNKYGPSPEVKLHCRELFHYDSRRKTAFKEYTKADIFTFYRGLLSELKNNNVYFRVGVVPRIIGHRSINLFGQFQIAHVTEKHLVPFAFISAIGHLYWNQMVRDLFVDGDKTIIDWFGKDQQVQYILKNLGGMQTSPILKNKPLLEIADCLAYSAAKVSSPYDRDKSRFMELITTCNPIPIPYTWSPGVLK